MENPGTYRKLRIAAAPSCLLAAACLLLLVIYLPTFSNPPHVDYWEAFYRFHLAGRTFLSGNLMSIVNHDPWQDGTFRPFSYTLLYLEYILFRGNFVWNHVVNFLLYCLGAAMLYRLAIRLVPDRLAAAVFLAVFIFLFPHSGILTLTFHQFLLVGFSSFLGGFILYIRWRRTGGLRCLSAAGLLFLIGMFCYEAFNFWPLAIVILRRLYSRRNGNQEGGARKQGWRYDAGMLVLVYLVYLAVLFLSRRVLGAGGELPEITAGGVGLSFCAAFFNLAYSGIFLGLVPFMALPCRFWFWVELGGPVTSIPEDALPAYIIGGGSSPCCSWPAGGGGSTGGGS